MIINGVDLSKIDKTHEKPKPLPVVKGRVVHVDADFIAYMVSYKEDLSVSEMQSNCSTIVETIRLMTGAERADLYLTPKGSDKGKRNECAMLKEYQANRAGKEKPKYLHMIREYMHKEIHAILCHDHEADDGMAAAQYAAISRGESHLSVIASKDKDLTMVPGLMYDWDTHVITDTKDDPFGWIELDTSKSTKKVIGRGWKFFWAQMLMGDQADNISGLPKCWHPDYLTKKGLGKACGAVMTYNLLESIETNKEAAILVANLYTLCHKEQGFKNYRDGSDITARKAMISEMQLLWMRNVVNDEYDVINWLSKECK